MLTRTEKLVCINTEIQAKLFGKIQLLHNIGEHKANIVY